MGSGNLGATNVGRALGRRFGIAVYFLDFAKGLAPVLIARHALCDPHLFGGRVPLALVMGIAAILGHCFPVWLGFRGGKGVATASGVVMALTPWTALIGFAVFAIALVTTRIVSVGSCLAALTLPIGFLLTEGPSDVWADPARKTILIAYAALALLVVFLHRANIRRLIAGEENKIGKKKESRS